MSCRCAGANLSISARTSASAARRAAADCVLAGTLVSLWTAGRLEGAFFATIMAPWEWISAAEDAPRPPGTVRGRRINDDLGVEHEEMVSLIASACQLGIKAFFC